jgi:hypothetical protein
MVVEDRSMWVQPNQVVRTAWVDIDLYRLSFRAPMSPEAVEEKYRRLLNLGDCARGPPSSDIGKMYGSSSVTGGTISCRADDRA